MPAKCATHDSEKPQDSDQTPSLVTKIDRDGSELIEKSWFEGKTFRYSTGESWERHSGTKHTSIIGDLGWEDGGFDSLDENAACYGYRNVYHGIWASDYTDIAWGANIKDLTKATASLENLAESDATLKDTMKAATLNEFITAATAYNSIISSDDGSGRIPSVDIAVNATALSETTSASTILENISADVSFTETITTSSYSSTINCSSSSVMFMGTRHFDYYRGGRLAVEAGGSVDVSLGLYSQINLLGYVELTKGRKCDVVLGNELEATTGQTFDLGSEKKTISLKCDWKSLVIFLG